MIESRHESRQYRIYALFAFLLCVILWLPYQPFGVGALFIGRKSSITESLSAIADLPTTTETLPYKYCTTGKPKPSYESSAYNDIYYIPTNTRLEDVHPHVGMLFKGNSDIVRFSSYSLLYIPAVNETHLQGTLKHLVGEAAQSEVKQKAVLITTWFPSWGHMVDSITVLADFFYRHRLNELGFKVMLSVPLDGDVISNVSQNALEIAQILLGNHFVNLWDLEEHWNLLRFQEVVLIHHSPATESFLSLPQPMVNILQNHWNDGIVGPASNIFLSRNTENAHRILDNHAQIEDFFKNHGFLVINPEYFPNKDLYNILKNARNVVITNGSALSSLILLSLQSRIFCLNSAGYQPMWRQGIASEEDLPSDADSRDDFEKYIWKNAVSRFDFTYVDSFLNRISDKQLDDIIANLK